MLDKNNYVFETSWEVCNKNGGIYTVLSTHAKALKSLLEDRLIFIGPDFGNPNNQYFKEEKGELKAWKDAAKKAGLAVKVGRWNLPDAQPLVILVEFGKFMVQKDAFFGEMWEKFGVDSLGAVGDYIEDTVFAMAAGKVIEHFVAFNKIEREKVVAHFHEWQTAGGLLYLKGNAPEIKTAFTTHATTTGRSICFNGKQLYAYFDGYNGDQMASELGVSHKHCIEKKAAQNADIFTTVSDLTAKECKQLLDVEAFVTPNGFDASFVPKAAKYTKARKDAREELKNVAEALLGYALKDDALFVATSGRFEWRNKGIDVFMESLNRLGQADLEKEVVAFVMVPSWVAGPREDLKNKLAKKCKCELEQRSLTHWVNGAEYNEILCAMRNYGMNNDEVAKVKVIYVPCLLDGKDGIFTKSYYDLLIGMDLTVFASYYEPWGYTPLESAAFSVPTVTTDLAGFGLWVKDNTKGEGDINNGVQVIHRDDNNGDEVCNQIKDAIVAVAAMSEDELKGVRKKAQDFAKKASWDKFIKFYEKAYEKALKKK